MNTSRPARSRSTGEAQEGQVTPCPCPDHPTAFSQRSNPHCATVYMSFPSPFSLPPRLPPPPSIKFRSVSAPYIVDVHISYVDENFSGVHFIW